MLKCFLLASISFLNAGLFAMLNRPLCEYPKPSNKHSPHSNDTHQMNCPNDGVSHSQECLPSSPENHCTKAHRYSKFEPFRKPNPSVFLSGTTTSQHGWSQIGLLDYQQPASAPSSSSWSSSSSSVCCSLIIKRARTQCEEKPNRQAISLVVNAFMRGLARQGLSYEWFLRVVMVSLVYFFFSFLKARF